MLETKISNVKDIKRNKSALILNLNWKCHYKCRDFEKWKESRKIRTGTEGGREPLGNPLTKSSMKKKKKPKMLRVKQAESTSITLRIHYTQHYQDSEIFL